MRSRASLRSAFLEKSHGVPSCLVVYVERIKAFEIHVSPNIVRLVDNEATAVYIDEVRVAGFGLLRELFDVLGCGFLVGAKLCKHICH